MAAYYLLKDELQYELAIRGMSAEGTVAEMRKRVTRAMAEKSIPLKEIYSKLNPETEIEECSKKLQALLELIEATEPGDSREVQRLEAKLGHIRNRVMRVQATGELKAEWDHAQQLLGIAEKDFKAIQRPRERGSVENLQTNREDTLTTPETRDSGALVSQAQGLTGNTTPEQYKHYQDLKIYKWGLTYSGDDSRKTLGGFLAEVEDRRVARGISKQDLFQSASELFSGTALLWFRNKRTTIKSWDDLVGKLRSTFLDVDYDYKLMEEIRQRTQGPEESAAIYIAKMQGLFGRLTRPVPEEEKLDLIGRNIRGDLRPFLPLTEYNSVDDLERVLARLEVGATMATRYVEPPATGHLEPDLAYNGRGKISRQEPKGYKEVRRERLPNNNQPGRMCWYCRETGHLYRTCPRRNRNSEKPTNQGTSRTFKRSEN